LIDHTDSKNYLKVDALSTSAGMLTAWQSLKPVDTQWDAFLASSPYSHFYQSSMWGEVRKLDGWQPLITVITLDDIIIGGFQMLWRRKSYLGKVGLVLKGPVVESDDPVVMKFTVATLKNTAQINGIRAMIIQPADRDDKMHARLRSSGLSENYNSAVKTNTLVVDLTKEENDILKRMKADKRSSIRKAMNMGVTIHEGTQVDLPHFFSFMVDTCKRQQVLPSPSDFSFLLKLWETFSKTGSIKLLISQYEGADVSMNLVLLTGKNAFLWKFGWSGTFGNLHPNELLNWGTLKWAKSNGYSCGDMGAIDYALAEVILKNEKVDNELSRTYSYFKVGFGGNVVPLSKGFVYIPNPIIRLGYNLFMPIINKYPYLKKKMIFGE
jgi:lipid II:glycine glycyltransferase (peptidoglycan interpeptide bridge formation enzyme)